MKDNQILITYGKNPVEMTKLLLEKADVLSEIPSKDSKIGLKPNLILSSTPDQGAVTHTEIVVTIIEYLQSHGYNNISIIESSWVGDSTQRAFKLNGYDKLSAKYHVPLVDVKHDEYQRKSALGVTMEVSSEILDCDYLINLPVLKGHCQTLMTCAMKNLKGCISDRSKRQFHSLGLSKPIAALNQIIKPSLTIVDSLNGDLDFEEGGTPVQTDRMLCAKDSILLDCYCATLLGYSPSDIGYIKVAMNAGIGNSNLSGMELVQLGETTVGNNHGTGRARVLEKYTQQDSACSACYANLIHALARLDEDGMLPRNPQTRICIGQGFRGKTGDCGVGNCTKLFEHTVAGCPPTAKAIKDMLEDLL